MEWCSRLISSISHSRIGTSHPSKTWLFEVQNYRAFVNLFHLLSQSPSSHAKTLIPNNTNIIMYMFYYASISEKNTKNKITENHCNTQISYIQILFGGRSQNGCVIKFLCFKVSWMTLWLCHHLHPGLGSWTFSLYGLHFQSFI